MSSRGGARRDAGKMSDDSDELELSDAMLEQLVTIIGVSPCSEPMIP